MTGALVLAVLLTIETPPPLRTPSDSPLKASIARAAASVTLADPPPSAFPAAAVGGQRCSKKAATIAGTVIGAVAFGVVAHQTYKPNFVLTQTQQTWAGVAFGAGLGAVLGYEACAG